MKLHELKPAKGAKKRRKILGRGGASGLGTTSGKGHKGQNARSGGNRHPRFEGGQMPIIRRIPKRGFTNIFKKVYTTVNLDTIVRLELEGEVTVQALAERGVARANLPLKILGRGDLDKPIVVKAARFSKSAVEKIEKAGGKAITV